ncbi:17.2 kDa class II heat shock protein-like protein [Drosera capensis]
MDWRSMGFDGDLISTLHDLIDFTEDAGKHLTSTTSTPSHAYVRDAKAMAKTQADVKESPNSFEYVVDMPGVKPTEVKVQLEDGNVLVVSGERKRVKEREEKEGIKYVRMERRAGKFMRRFVLPENANTDRITARCEDGVVTVMVEKVPPPEPKKPRIIEVMVGSSPSDGTNAGPSSDGAKVGSPSEGAPAVQETQG